MVQRDKYGFFLGSMACRGMVVFCSTGIGTRFIPILTGTDTSVTQNFLHWS